MACPGQEIDLSFRGENKKIGKNNLRMELEHRTYHFSGFVDSKCQSQNKLFNQRYK